MSDSKRGWRDRLAGFVGDVQDELDRAGRKLGLVPETERGHEIVAYRSHGNSERVLLQGRVIKCRRFSRGTPGDSLWTNLLNTYRRMDSDALPHAKVRVDIGGAERVIEADNEGFFREWIDLKVTLKDGSPWHEVPLTLDMPGVSVSSTAWIRIPAGAPAFGVISDLDDTVIQSGLTSFLRAARAVLLGNALTRLPFPGVAAFYRALEAGDNGQRANPIYYVSSSPWNIYDIVADFMDIQKIPIGSIHLRDWDIDFDALSSHRLKSHKAPIIREIMSLNPELPFILIGDDSQHDPEIYRAILDEFPGRVLAIYIRNVRTDPERSASVKLLADQVLKAGSALVLADDTFAAASHAAEQGWISRDSLVAIHEEKRADEGTSGAKADVPSAPEPPAAPTVVVE